MTDEHEQFGELDQLDAALGGFLARADLWDEPPAALEDQIVAAITAEAAPAEQDHGRAARPRHGAWVLAVAAAAIMLVVLGALLFTSDGGSEPAFALFGTDLAPDATGEATVFPTPAGVRIMLEVSDLPPAPEGQFYQGWLRSSDDAVSVGTFHLRNGNTPIALWSGIDDPAYDTLSITLQDQGAGPESSRRVVLVGALDDDE